MPNKAWSASQTASIRSSGEAMSQSLSGGSGKPSRMTLTGISEFCESSTMRAIIRQTRSINPVDENSLLIPQRRGWIQARGSKGWEPRG